jgi:hypothetical protein
VGMFLSLIARVQALVAAGTLKENQAAGLIAKLEQNPRLRPATRFFLACDTTGTSRATGVPCSVMITSLPAKACASKSGNLS